MRRYCRQTHCRILTIPAASLVVSFSILDSAAASIPLTLFLAALDSAGAGAGAGADAVDCDDCLCWVIERRSVMPMDN